MAERLLRVFQGKSQVFEQHLGPYSTVSLDEGENTYTVRIDLGQPPEPESDDLPAPVPQADPAAEGSKGPAPKKSTAKRSTAKRSTAKRSASK